MKFISFEQTNFNLNWICKGGIWNLLVYLVLVLKKQKIRININMKYNFAHWLNKIKTNSHKKLSVSNLKQI